MARFVNNVAVSAGMLILALLASDAPPAEPAVDPGRILESMEAATSSIRDYTMVLVRQERLRGKLLSRETISVKWSRPQRTYVRYIDPHEGREAIYVRGWNQDRLRVHKGSFPDINLNIAPKGNMAMSATHHPADDASLLTFVDLVLQGYRKGTIRNEGTTRWLGPSRFRGRPCDRIELTSPPGGIEDTVRRGETLWDVARRHRANMYAILHSNLDRGWKKATSPDAGDRVFVPHYYAGRVLLWIDRELKLPVKAEIYDHAGELYEYYEHRDLRLNVGLNDRDFDPKNPDYDF